MTSLHFIAQFENNTENVAQVRKTTEKTDQGVTQIKDDVAKIRG